MITIVTFFPSDKTVSPGIKNLLSLDTPLVVFTPSESKMLLEVGNNQTMIKESEEREPIKFLYKVVKNNPFNSTYFVWLRHDVYEHQREFPDPYKIRMLDDNKLLLSHKRDDSILAGTEIAIKNVYYFSFRDGMINVYPFDGDLPYELAVGTKIRVGYSINKHIKLLTTATKEIPDSDIEKWLESAIYFGYDFEILGREEKWKGFVSKTINHYNALKRMGDKYVLLTDCTDLFFAGSAHEMYDKVVAAGFPLIVGGELEPWYSNGKSDLKLMKKFFKSIQRSPQAFPNAGFIMGRRDRLLKMLEIHLDYKDDQVACFDTIYENKMELEIDYETKFVCNIPSYPFINHINFINQEFDEKEETF